MNFLAALVMFAWSDPVNNPTTVGYHVERAAGACAADSKFQRITPNPLPTRTFQDNPPAGTWCYRVVSIVDGEAADPSNAVTYKSKPSPATDLRIVTGPG